MPEPSDQERRVTQEVYNRFSGDTYSTYRTPDGMTVWTFGRATNERWIDVDGDGFWDYGRRPESDGNWSLNRGWGWESDTNPRPPIEDDIDQDELDPGGGISVAFFDKNEELFPNENSNFWAEPSFTDNPGAFALAQTSMSDFSHQDWFL